MAQPKKGDRLQYTGSYASADITPYADGVAVGFRNTRHGPPRRLVIVELVDGSGYADWPVDEVEVASWPSS